MPGIAGVVHSDGSRVELPLVRRMLSSCSATGADRRRVWSSGPVAFGIAPSLNEQPAVDPEQRLAVVYEGRLLNRLPLRESLRRLGRQFVTDSDAEVVLQAYDTFDATCASQVHGPGVWAVWDGMKQRLMLVRDRLGEQTLYYTQVAGKLLFASEIKAIFAHPEVTRELDLAALNQSFTLGGILPGRTAFAGIRELPPGHRLMFADDRLHVSRYWQLDFSLNPGSSRREDDCCEELLERLEDATSCRLRTVARGGVLVESASHASMGVGDGCGLTMALARGCAFGQLETATVHHTPWADGAALAADVASGRRPEFIVREQEYAAGGRSRRLMVDPQRAVAAWADVVAIAERPLFDLRLAAQYAVAEQLQHLGWGAALTSTGASELFGGEELYRGTRIREFCAAQPDSAWRRQLLAELGPIPRAELAVQTSDYLREAFCYRSADLSATGFSHLLHWRRLQSHAGLLTEDVRRAGDPVELSTAVAALLPAHVGQWDTLGRAQFLELALPTSGTPAPALQTRLFRSRGLAVSSPFWDHRVAEFAAQLPARLKQRGRSGNYLLRRALAHRGWSQATPQAARVDSGAGIRALLGDGVQPGMALVEELLSSERLHEDGLFEPAVVHELVAQVRRSSVVDPYVGRALVGVLSTQILVDRYLRDAGSWQPTVLLHA